MTRAPRFEDGLVGPFGRGDREGDHAVAWLTNPDRVLPAGATLGALAGSDLEMYKGDADEALTSAADLGDDEGPALALRRAAARGAGTYDRWWGHPAWHARIKRITAALDDPADEHPGPHGEFLKRLPPEPDTVQDRYGLRTVPRRSPWDLDGDSARSSARRPSAPTLRPRGGDGRRRG